MIVQHDSFGRAEDKHGNLYVEERIALIPNRNNYGHHEEHHATTRSHALQRAREVWGPDAVIRAALGFTQVGSGRYRRYAVVVPR